MPRSGSADFQQFDSEFVGKKHPVNGDLEGFGCVGLHIHSEYLPSLPVTLNHGAILGSGKTLHQIFANSEYRVHCKGFTRVFLPRAANTLWTELQG
jgi:hypothetical protein